MDQDMDKLRDDYDRAEGELQAFLDRIEREIMDSTLEAAAAVETAEDIEAAFVHLPRLEKLKALREAARASLEHCVSVQEFIDEIDEDEADEDEPPPPKSGKRK